MEENELKSGAGTPVQGSVAGEVLLLLPHHRASVSGPVGTLFEGLGAWFYTLGFSAEYVVKLLWRILRNAFRFLAQIAVLLGLKIGGAVFALLRGIALDIAEPVIEFRRRRHLLERAHKQAEDDEARQAKLVKVGMRNSLLVAARLAGYLMPLAAAAIFVVIVASVLGMDYALVVKYNGEELGYVADQSVVEGAKGLLRDRIRLAKNQELSDWKMTLEYKIERTAKFTTTQQMVNKILRTSQKSGTDIMEATGMYLDDRLYTVTTDPARLQTYLDGVLQEYIDQSPPEAQVSFVKEVSFDDPADEPVYFTSSVEDTNALIERLSGDAKPEKAFVADGAMNLQEIAHTHNLTLETLLLRNPELAQQADAVPAAEDADKAQGDTKPGADKKDDKAPQEEALGGAFIPAPGTEVLIERAQPVLQVQTSIRRQSNEAVPYQTIEEENDKYPKGVKMVTQKGKEGLSEVWDDYIYIDGELVSTVRVEELTTILEEPVDEIVAVGTMEILSAPGASIGGNGAGYIFPVPDSPYSSRGMGGGHRGLDINAAANAPIYACAGGSVTVAGWHYSYGNYIVIEHEGGVATLYAHCNALYVTAGQQVTQGQNIAAVGSTGDSTGNHLHLEVTVSGQRVDPVAFVGYPY